jgi:hypothetical protein
MPKKMHFTHNQVVLPLLLTPQPVVLLKRLKPARQLVLSMQAKMAF